MPCTRFEFESRMLLKKKMDLDIVYKVKELINQNKTHKDIGNILSLTRSQVNYACNFDIILQEVHFL